MHIATNAGHTTQNDGWPLIMLATTHLMFTSGLQGEKTSKFFFVPNELKSPKNMFFSTFGGGWVVKKQMWNFPHFFNPSLKGTTIKLRLKVEAMQVKSNH